MSAPPLSDGAVQERSIAVRPSDVAVREVGAPGAVAASVVALATLERLPVPIEIDRTDTIVTRRSSRKIAVGVGCSCSTSVGYLISPGCTRVRGHLNLVPRDVCPTVIRWCCPGKINRRTSIRRSRKRSGCTRCSRRVCGRIGDVGRITRTDRINGADSVMTRRSSRKITVGVGCSCSTSVGYLIRPGCACVRGHLNLVSRDGCPTVIRWCCPRKINRRTPSDVAVREVGAPGAVTADVVALATLEGLPVPAELIALTR